MARPKPKHKKIKLHLEMAPKVARRLDWLMEQTEADSRTEVFRNALVIYERMCRMANHHGVVTLESLEGETILLAVKPAETRAEEDA